MSSEDQIIYEDFYIIKKLNNKYLTINETYL